MNAEAAVGAASPMSPERRRARRWEAPHIIVAGAVALVAVIVGIFVLLCFQGYASTINNARERVETAAGVVAEETKWVFAATRSTLGQLAGRLGGDPAAATPQAMRDLESAMSSLPMQARVGIYNAAGDLVAAGPATAPAMESVADADFFDAVAGGEPWALSAQLRHPETGEATFAVARRLDSGGTFRGAALAIVDADVLRSLADSQDLGEGSTISVIRTDGWIIARTPPLSAPANVSNMENFALLMASESGSYESGVSPVDGVARIVGFHHVPELGYIAIASIARDTVLAGLWNSIWIVSWLIAPIAVALLVGSLITARVMRRTQATSRSLAEALAHNEVLFREIHHRVKNNLQAINSLLQLHPIPREVRADMSQRIAAMSAVHEHIYRSHTFARVQVKDYLHKLIDNIRAVNDPSVQVIVRIEDVAVDKDAATPLGLIVNEVVSNAFKHAFGDGRSGTIEITLVGEGDTARLTVHDNGTGFDPEAPAKGIGRRLIGGLTAQLHGESTHTSDADGSTFTLTFPLARD
jgi:two-component sensor histidine kinase